MKQRLGIGGKAFPWGVVEVWALDFSATMGRDVSVYGLSWLSAIDETISKSCAMPT